MHRSRLFTKQNKTKKLDLLRKSNVLTQKRRWNLNPVGAFQSAEVVCEIATRAAAGVGVYVDKDVIIAWATNSTALLNGLIELIIPLHLLVKG